MERDNIVISYSNIRKDFFGTAVVVLNTGSYQSIPRDTILVWDDTNNVYKVATSNTNPAVISPSTRHVRLLQNLTNLTPNSNINVLVATLFVALSSELKFYNTTTSSFENGVIIDRPAGGFTINS
jgi:hypothetical protein